MIGKIRGLPEMIEAAVKGLNDSQLDTPYGPGKWTGRQVIHHLADSHMHAFIRTKTILLEDRPTLATYNQNQWANASDAAAPTPIESSLLILRGLHARWVAMLEHVPESGWSRPAIHPERGEVTLEALLAIYASHGEKHAKHITDLRAAKGW